MPRRRKASARTRFIRLVALIRNRVMTQHQVRPQESVWDYPRPPRLETDHRRILVRRGDSILADSIRSIRVLETSHPPVFYVPSGSVRTGLLTLSSIRTMCEFKGVADYWDLGGPEPIPRVAWSYPQPLAGYEDIAGWLAFFPGKVECYVGGERALPQEGGFYGGWITSEIVGPFKGAPGTDGW